MSKIIKQKRRVCDCCDNSMFRLIRKPIEQQMDETPNLGVKNIIKSETVDELDENGRYIVEWCVDFLLFAKLGIEFPKKDKKNCTYHKEKYVSLWRFVCDFLNIPKNSGYDYYVMEWLEWNFICKHGSAIRCAWFETDAINPYATRELSEERKQLIIDWGNNLDDEFD